jgi:hypothetical protein
MTFGSADYKSHKESKIVEPTEPQVWYIDDAIEYLREGYPDILAIWEEAKKKTSDRLAKVISVWEDIEDKVCKEIGAACPSLVEWDARGQPQIISLF